jgi:ankyrin repeat protein
VVQDLKKLSVVQLSKYGHFEELCRRASTLEKLDVAQLFERAVTDFRTVKRNPGHQQILQWCIDQGLDFGARAGWLNESVVCLAARYGNRQIIDSMIRRGLPNDPFARASVGDIEFLQGYACHNELSHVRDKNGFNLLFACAGSALGRIDPGANRRLADVCRLLLERGVSPSHEVIFELPIFPAYLCASFGGNQEVMRRLLEHGSLTPERLYQTMEHTLEPHQRSGEPFYHIAEIILSRGFNVNDKAEKCRTLLHGSANRGSLVAVQWLLDHGADPNALDDHGRTPLHVCAERNTATSVLKLLIDVGSDPNIRDSSGRTPLDYSRQNARTTVVTYLTSIGAKCGIRDKSGDGI